jgi:arsenite methyltransferase
MGATERTTAADRLEVVRERYGEAAAAVLAAQDTSCCGSRTGQDTSCCGSRTGQDTSCCGPATGAVPAVEALQAEDVFGSGLYGAETTGLPEAAVLASLGCGNPTAVADLHPGERVLDLGSGGGIDVLLSARRVGPEGFVYGVDMTPGMLELARRNAREAGAANVQFLEGRIEAVPLPDASVDVVISNCVVNLSTDKPAVLAEMFRVLAPGGRIGISDVVAEDHLTPTERAERGDFAGCIAGALSRQEYLAGLAAADFAGAEVHFTHEVRPGLHGAVVRATRPR